MNVSAPCPSPFRLPRGLALAIARRSIYPRPVPPPSREDLRKEQLRAEYVLITGHMDHVGVAGGGTSGDRHLLAIDRDRWLLYESYGTFWNGALGRWEAGSGAVFNIATNDRRPEGWTSADAAGLAIFSGLVRYDEAFGTGEIAHAFRVTTRATNGYVWPASHAAGSNASAPPMGARLRLKASKDISGFPSEVQKIFRAMKRYGLIVADNGSDMYISGTTDARWNNDVLNPAFRALTADDFELVQLGWRSTRPNPPTNLRIIR